MDPREEKGIPKEEFDARSGEATGDDNVRANENTIRAELGIALE